MDGALAHISCFQSMFALCITWRAWVLSWWMFCRLKKPFITTTANTIFWNIIQRHFTKSIFCLDMSPLSPSRWLGGGGTRLLAARWSWGRMWSGDPSPLCCSLAPRVSFLLGPFLWSAPHPMCGEEACRIQSWFISIREVNTLQMLCPLWKAPFKRTDVKEEQ